VSTGLDAISPQLLARFGGRFSRAEIVRRQHANAVTWIAPQPPDAVVEAESTEEVVAVVKLCAAHGVPIIPFGTGTSVEGHVNAPHGGLCLSLRRMNRILSVNPEDFDVTAEAGTTREQINAYCRDVGLFFPVDPGADASVGGMVATRASGTNAVRYGTMRENVVALTVVLPDGAVARTASRARKSAAGLDMTRLLVGSEGTLGIITEVVLRLHGIPEAVIGGTCAFPDIASACDTAITVLQSGIPVARMELLDARQIQACNAYSGLTLPETPHLFVEFHGTPRFAQEQADNFMAIAQDHGGANLSISGNAEERNRLWKARHQAFWAAVATRPGSFGVSTDICVPISRLTDCIEETRRDMDQSGIPGTIQGHVGDGNFHAIPLVDPADEAEVARLEAFLDRLAARAHAAGGTCTGEHGIGQNRRKYMVAEFGAPLVGAMRAVKQALDPLGIMNPGKMLPEVESA
jgi:D-lactate dehydrogenase (cytochrome)